ncbi:MAG: carboxypeptidase-like regulatory domain-containing protein [Candidatus Sericytochromatia bacterium]|nr:carboxypeptidase-like regulatory domain-containing protein [Candidatus Sericytochromatia bacterium]
MPAKKLVLATLVATLLAGCGGNANQPALPGDGTYSDVVLPADDFGASEFPELPTDVGLDQPPAASAPVASAPAGVDGQIGDPGSAGFTLRGLVADLEGRPIAGAKVSIGAQTTLTTTAGAFTISGIMDTQVWVDVTAEGYVPMAQVNVPFSADRATVDKEFRLGLAGSSGSPEGGGDDAGPAGPRLVHEGTFAGPAFLSVAAMAAEGDRVYVLGKLDKPLWFDRMAVVVFDAASGEEISRIGDRLFGRVSRTASSLKLDNGRLTVADGRERVTFDASGAYVSRASGTGFPALMEVEDADRALTYALKAGNKVLVTGKNLEETLPLAEVGRARALGLNADGELLVLDSSERLVHRFRFER